MAYLVTISTSYTISEDQIKSMKRDLGYNGIENDEEKNLSCSIAISRILLQNSLDNGVFGERDFDIESTKTDE